MQETNYPSLENNPPENNMPPQRPQPQVPPQPKPEIPPQFLKRAPLPEMPPEAPKMPPQMPTSNYAPPKGRAGGVFKILLTVIILLIIAGGALGAVLYTRVWDPLWSPFRPKPEVVLEQMISNMQNVKTLNSQTKINLLAPDGKRADVVVEGISDITDASSPQSDMTASIILSGSSAPGSVDSLKVNVIIFAKDLYFKVSEFNSPSLGMMLAMFGVDPAKITGVWIKVPANLQNQVAAKTTQAPTAGVITTQAPSTQTPTEEQIKALTKKVQKIFLQNKIYSVKEQLPDKTLNGEKMYNYIIKIDNENLIKAFGQVMQEAVNLQSASMQDKAAAASSPYMIGAMKGAIGEFLDKVGEIDINVLIGKKDVLLYNFSVQKSLDLADLSQGQATGIINIGIEGSESKFNQLTSIMPPTEFKTFEELFPVQPINSKTTSTIKKK